MFADNFRDSDGYIHRYMIYLHITLLNMFNFSTKHLFIAINVIPCLLHPLPSSLASVIQK